MKHVLIVLAVLFGIILVALLGFKLYDYIGAAEYYNNSEVVFKTPGVADSNFVPQGMTYVPENEENGTFYFTGYMGKPMLGELDGDVAARVYFCDKNGDNLGYAKLYFEEGKPYTDHTGGIEVVGKYVYITGEDSHGLDVFLLEDVLKGEAIMLGTVKTYNSPAYVYAYEQNGQKYIMAGSYHKEGEIYETPEHERMKTPNGDKNTSTMTVFELNESAELGIDPTPVAIISMREMVQGICITPDGQMVVSSSWGLATSNLYFYDLSKVQSATLETYEGKIVYGDLEEIKKNPDKDWEKENVKFTNIPCYYVDSSCLVKTVVAAPMSEELVCLDGKIIVFCESACNKYLFGKITTGFNTYGYKYETLK